MAQSLWQEIKGVFQEEIDLSDTLDPSQAGNRLRNFLVLIREIFRSVQQDQAVTMATAMAYKTLIALVPLLAISLSVVALLEQGSAAVEGVSSNTYTDAFLQVINERMPQFTGKEELLQSVRGFAENARLIMGVSFLVFFGTAYSLLGSIENAFHVIWQVKENRYFLNRVGAFLSTILIVPILMSLSVYFTTKIVTVVEHVERVLPIGASMESGGDEDYTPDSAEVTPGGDNAPGAKGEPLSSADEDGQQKPSTLTEKRTTIGQRSALMRGILALASFITTVCAMTALYYLLPNTPVRLKPALIGGVLCGLGLEFAKIGVQVFALYVGENYTKIYGPLLAMPFFLIWLLAVWVIVLIGAEVAFVAQNFRDLAARAEMERRGIQSRIYLAVRVVLSASDLFHRGDDPENIIDALAEELALPPYIVQEVVHTLMAGGILRRVTPGRESYVPARDISVLTVEDVIYAVESDHLEVPKEPDDEVRRYLEDLFVRTAQARRTILGGQSFSQLVSMAQSWDTMEDTVELPFNRTENEPQQVVAEPMDDGSEAQSLRDVLDRR